MSRYTKIFLGSLLFFLLGSFLFTPQVNAQKLEITPYTGYMFGGSIRGYNGDFRIRDRGNYGGSLGVTVARGTQMEFSYLRHDSDGRLITYGNFFDVEEKFDLASEYIQLGVVKEAQQGRVRPFGLISFGASAFTAKDTPYDVEWFFSSTLGAGVKAYLTDNIGLRFQGRLLVPMYFGGGGIWCGTGGCSVGLGAYSVILQGDIGVGLIIAISE